MQDGGANVAKKRSAVASYFSLFGSLSTLLCCALPSVLVLFGLGASVASALSQMPWLVEMSRHKYWTFGISGLLIAASLIYTYVLTPRLAADQCSADDPNACATASRMSKIILWISAALFAIGFFVAFLLGPFLAHMDAR